MTCSRRLAFSSLAAMAALVCWAQQGYIEGKVTLHKQPLAGAAVSIYLLDAAQSKYTYQWATSTDREGSFQVKSIPKGTCIVLVRYSGKVVYQNKVSVPSTQAQNLHIDLT